MAKKIRNPYAVAMMNRYGKTSKVMKDRRKGRGGSRNKVREILQEG